jgi:general stress protein YciG
MNNQKQLRGFALLSPERRKEITSKAGKRAHELGRAHEFTSEESSVAGKKGGRSVSMDRKHMAEIGRKGGLKVSQNKEHMAENGRKGGLKLSQNKEHMAEIGRKGGHISKRKSNSSELGSQNVV